MRPVLVALLIAVGGCTTMSVVPVANESLASVCIIRNPDVNVDNFVQVVQERFAYHGIKTTVVEGPTPASACPYTLEYTAERWWDMAPYMIDANLLLKKNNAIIASGHYHLAGHGGFDMAKFKGTEAKLDPIIDEMLAAYHRT